MSTGSVSPSKTDRAKGWFAVYGFRCLRFVLALGILVGVILPLLSTGKGLLTTKHVDDLLRRKPSDVMNSAKDAAGQADKPEERAAGGNSGAGQGSAESATGSESASQVPLVWAYGLQLAACAGLMTVSLWVIVILCRDD